MDIGAGDLTIAKELATEGFFVTALEPRYEGKTEFKIPLTVHKLTIDEFFCEKNVSLVLVLGLIYHLGNPEIALKNIESFGSKYVIIDSVVLDHDGDAMIYLNENHTLCGNSVTGKGCRPSPGWLINQMKSLGFPNVIDCSNRQPLGG